MESSSNKIKRGKKVTDKRVLKAGHGHTSFEDGGHFSMEQDCRYRELSNKQNCWAWSGRLRLFLFIF
jgi:hypothetical protein